MITSLRLYACEAENRTGVDDHGLADLIKIHENLIKRLILTSVDWYSCGFLVNSVIR